MIAERGPSGGGTMTLSRRSENTFSSRIIARPDGARQRTMSRRDFAAKYRPFTPDISQNYYPDSFQKNRQLITRQFSTYRDGATMNRSSINRTKREISTTIDVKKQQISQKETRRRTFPKMRLYELRERQKVSLTKPVSLEKKSRENELSKVSLIKKVSLEKKNTKQQETPKVSLFKKVSLDKKGSWISAFVGITKVDRSIEQPVRFVEENPKPKETVIFEAKQSEYWWAVYNGNLNKFVIVKGDNPHALGEAAGTAHILITPEFIKEHKDLPLNQILKLGIQDIENRTRAREFNPLEFGIAAKKLNKKYISEKKLFKKKEEETVEQPECCNHHCILEEQKDGIGTCPKSAVMFSYDTNAIEKARRANRPVRRSDWNVKNTFRLNVAYSQKRSKSMLRASTR